MIPAKYKIFCRTRTFGNPWVNPRKLLKALAGKYEFVNAVTYLFQKCYDDGKLPELWIQANITVLRKKGD